MNRNFTYLLFLGLFFFSQKTQANDSLNICVQTHLGIPVEQVNFILTGTNTISLNNTSPGCSSFLVENVSGILNVAPNKTINPGNGVDVLDLFLIRQNILGIQVFTSPFEVIASDVNESNGITTFDLVLIHKLILGLNTQIPIADSWKFVDASFVMPPFNPWGITNPFPETIQLNIPLNGTTDISFIGIKMGDVNFSSDPANFMEPTVETRSDDLILKIEDREILAGETFNVDITAENFSQIIGYQFTTEFNFSKLEFVEVLPQELSELTTANFNTEKVTEGKLPTAWVHHEDQSLSSDEVIFSITFKALANVLLSEVISFGDSPTPIAAYDISQEKMGITLEVEETVVNTDDELENGAIQFSNHPNPFQNATTLNYDLKNAGQVNLVITDATGKLVTTLVDEWQPAGNHNLTFTPKRNLASGVYFGKLKINDQVIIQKMVFMP